MYSPTTFLKMGVIYTIKSPSDKLYVGKTYDLRKRINSHKCAAKKDARGIILRNSIKKYGWDAHTLEIIEEVEEGKLNEREIYWIEKLKTYCYDNPMGMNMTKGGDGQRSTWMHKTELRKWFSERFSGENGPFYGHQHTKETKKIIGEKAKKRNLETGRKIPEWGVQKGIEKTRKAVVVYGNDGLLIDSFNSLTQCSKSLNITLGSVKDSVIYNSWIGGKYLVRYKTENFPNIIEVGLIKVKTEKRPVLTLNEDYEIICEHSCAQEASNFWGVPKTTINRAAMYNWLKPIRTGHVFIYTDLYNSIIAAEEAA